MKLRSGTFYGESESSSSSSSSSRVVTKASRSRRRTSPRLRSSPNSVVQQPMPTSTQSMHTMTLRSSRRV